MVTTTKSHIAESLKLIDRGLGKPSSFPLSANVRMIAGEEFLLQTTNHEADVLVKVETDVVEKPFDVIIDGKTFVKAMRKLSGVISFRVQSGKLSIVCEGSEFRLAITPGVFPDFDEPKEDVWRIVIDSESLHLALKQTMFATKDDENRPVVRGVYFGDNIVATDSSRLCISTIAVKGDFVLPAEPLSLCFQLSGEVEITASDNRVIFTDGERSISIAKLSIDYPNWRHLVPTDSPVRVIVNRTDLLAMADKASLVYDDYRAVALIVGEGKLTIAVRGDVNEYEESIEADTSGECTVHLSAQFIAEFLKVADTHHIEMGLNGDLKPCILKAGDYRCVMMPVRVS